MKDTLLNNFLRISSIPRESGNEEKIADFFIDIAQKNNLYFYKDKNNNVIIKKSGNHNGELIAFQAHLDMVGVKTENSNHDFNTDGIEVIINGDEVKAKDTSLGADQGVGLAIMLTLIEDNSLKHPDMEFLFTTEEETTFNGAVKFPYQRIKSKRLINLDGSNDKVIFVGADGDICNEYIFESSKIISNLPSYKVRISGFSGGNSSENINLSKNNAITTMARLLNNKDLFLAEINGGTNENDLATFCEVIINTNENVYCIFENSNAEIEKIDNIKCFSKNDTKNIIKQILELECGDISKNRASANLGMINTNDNEVRIKYIFRSGDIEELEQINFKLNNLNNKFVAREIYRDPIWRADKNSKILEIYRDIYFKEYGEYPINEIWRGAIECATIKNHIKGLDIISIRKYN